MRQLPLKPIFEEKGATFAERFGVEIPAVVSDLVKEYHFVRDAVGITDFSYMQKFRISGDEGLDILDALFAGNVAKIRYCRMLHTFLANEKGELVADAYIANNDEDYIVLCESVVDDAGLKTLLQSDSAAEAELEDLTESHVVVGIDGFRAWQVVKDLFGTDVLGLPYLSVETVAFNNEDVLIFRAGKTSEFGYMVMAPKAMGPELVAALLDAAEKVDGGLCGCQIHHDLRLEGRFFNIFAEGERVKDPLPLGLQWMIELDKESFLGSKAIFERREQGLKQKIIGVKVDDASTKLQVGDQIMCGDQPIATVEAAGFSHVLNAHIGLALFPFDVAYAGLDYNLGQQDGPAIRTISMPPIVPKSLSVKLDEV